MPAYRKALLPVLVAGCNFQHVQAVDIWTVLTETVFNQIAPNAVAPYTYSGFQTAVNNWNSNNAGYEVFQGSTEMAQRHELAVSRVKS
jgi:hypothetical protein